MSVPRGTTPTFTLTFNDENVDLTVAKNVYVTFKSGGKTLTKTGDDLVVEEKTISVYLTQQDTFAFATSTIEIQANWTTGNGGRIASEIVSYDISEQLLKKVIE